MEDKIELLRLAAKGRRMYMENAPDDQRDVLEIEAITLEKAVKVLEGNTAYMYGWLPTWMWTEDMVKRVNDPESWEK